jgi:signal transduction histidine kinase
VKSRETMEALENELGLAIQMRGLVRFHMAFVHDLRAPLNAMVMNLELLRQTLRNGAASNGDATTKERQLRYIGVLKDEISRVDRQLGTLLTHSSAPAGDTRMEIDLTELIRELAALLGPMAHHQRVSLETHLPPNAVRLTVQRDRLKQALLNIAINALEAMPEGGKLAIEVEPQGDSVRVAFRDSGPGIPPEVLENIYNMHFTTKAGGTGIGLYVARAVAEAHGGEIRVESSSGGGTCLGIYLPSSVEELSV